MSMVTDPKEAQSIAERLVTEIAFYNREKIRKSLRSDSLFDDLKGELSEGRDHYLSRVDPELEERLNLFNRAVVDIIVRPFGSEETTIW
jgi:hypothetical protein